MGMLYRSLLRELGKLQRQTAGKLQEIARRKVVPVCTLSPEFTYKLRYRSLCKLYRSLLDLNSGGSKLPEFTS